MAFDTLPLTAESPKSKLGIAGEHLSFEVGNDRKARTSNELDKRIREERCKWVEGCQGRWVRLFR